MNLQVPYVYWVSFLTLQVTKYNVQVKNNVNFQGNLVNIPFAIGEAKTLPSFGHIDVSFSTLVHLSFQMATSLAAVALPNWRDLELVVGLVLVRSESLFLSFETSWVQVCLTASLIWIIIPESPRWLISQVSFLFYHLCT